MKKLVFLFTFPIAIFLIIAFMDAKRRQNLENYQPPTFEVRNSLLEMFKERHKQYEESGDTENAARLKKLIDSFDTETPETKE